MIFAHSKMLWLLAVTLPALSLFLWWSWRKKQRLIAQFVQSRLLAHLTVGLARSVQKTRLVLLVVSVALILLALAQPQWGFVWEEAKQRGLDIVVAIDTSRSMLAEDIAPNRLERTKLAALDLMRLAKHDRLALVAFAGTAFLQCPLTLDDEAFRQSLSQVEVGIIPQGGTAIAEAIETAQAALKEEGENHRVLILLTDGEDHDSGALEAAEKASKAGLRIFTIGVGTANGELLRQRDDKGNLDYVKDAEGNVVKSRLDERLLTQIATSANGFYLPLSGASTMEVLYQRGLAPLPKSEVASKLIRHYHERFQWALALAILCLLAEVFLPDRKMVRRSQAALAATNPELRKLVALLLISLIGRPGFASPASALRQYESGQFKDAHQEYLRLLQRKPDDVRLQFNAGDAAYQAKEFEEAAKHFSTAATAPDLHLQERAYYNLGNSLYRVGEGETDSQKKSETWGQAVKQFESALKLEPKDADASYNLDLVKKRLEELKQQQQEQQKQQQQPPKDQNKDSKDQDQKEENKRDKQDQSKDSKPKSDPTQEDKNQEQKPKPEQKEPSPDQKREQAQRQGEKDKDQGKEHKEQSGSEQEKERAGEKGETNAAPSAAAALGQMTPEQAKQLLDSQKNDQKAMIFIPPDQQKTKKRAFKDW